MKSKLKTDKTPNELLDDAVEKWEDGLAKNLFINGNEPNLADLVSNLLVNRFLFVGIFNKKIFFFLSLLIYRACLEIPVLMRAANFSMTLLLNILSLKHGICE